ncbi:MAG: MlaD family protein [Rhodothermales bacterium]
MKYSNELKVGASLLIATAIFILGVRYFEDLPLFRPTLSLTAEFDDAGGLIAGNVVRVNGVNVGSVNGVRISPSTGNVIVDFHVDSSLPVTEGTTGAIAGFDALGVVRMDLMLGPPDAPRIPEGGRIATQPMSDAIASLTARAPGMVDRVDSVLVGLDRVLGGTDQMLNSPDSDLRSAIGSVDRSVQQLEALLLAERERIGRVMANVESATADLDTAAGEDGERLAALMDSLQSTLDGVDRTLVDVRSVSVELTAVLAALNNGEGTLGMLLKDPSMYHKMDSTLTGLNALMADFQANPGRYLKEMRIVDLF